MIKLLTLILLVVPAGAGELPPVPSGWNECKWNDPLHLTPKYVVGRITAGFPHTPNGLKAALPAIQATYPGSKISPKHKDGDSVEIPCVGIIDMVVATNEGHPDEGESWAWQVDEDYCVQCSPNRCDEVSWGSCPRETAASAPRGGEGPVTSGGSTGDGSTGGSTVDKGSGNCRARADRSDVVADAKAELENADRDLSGDCGDFEIVKRAVWKLKDTGAGLLSKTTGFNCDGYASDIIAYADGRHYDVVIGGTNAPSWQDNGCVDDPSRWRKPIDPGKP